MVGIFIFYTFWACAHARIQENLFFKRRGSPPTRAEQGVGFTLRSKLDCVKECSKYEICGKIRFEEIEGEKMCWLNTGGGKNADRYKKSTSRVNKSKYDFEEGKYHIGFTRENRKVRCFGPSKSRPTSRIDRKVYGEKRVFLKTQRSGSCPPFLVKHIGRVTRFVAPSFPNSYLVLSLTTSRFDFMYMYIGPVSKYDTPTPASFKKTGLGNFCITVKQKCIYLIFRHIEKTNDRKNIVDLAFTKATSHNAVRFYVKKVQK